MSSQRRILASRANGARSRGPVTPEGKRRSSQNAVRHGLLADCVLLPGESRENFERLLEQHLDRFGPLDDVEYGMIEEMAASYWRLRRAWAVEKTMLSEALPPESAGDPLNRIAAAYRQLGASADLPLIHRYETRLHRMYQRALRNLLRLGSPDFPNEPSPISEHDPPGPAPEPKP